MVVVNDIRLRRADESEMGWINQRYTEIGFVHSVFQREVIAIAEVDGEIAGLGRLVTIDENNLELGGMYVFETFRGQGVARKIVQFLLKQALSSHTIYCIPFEHLIQFYREFGFRACSNAKEIPKELLEKYLWCQKQYDQPTSLLVLSR